MNQLIIETQPAGADIKRGKAFAGIDFGDNGVPIDMASLFLTGADLLLVDNFQRLQETGCKSLEAPPEREERIVRNMEKMVGVIKNLGAAFGREPAIIKTSDFMGGSRYSHVLQEASARIMKDDVLLKKALAAAPGKEKGTYESLIYTMNEAACCDMMAREQRCIKIGPLSEKAYDEVTAGVVPYLKFAYLEDAHPLRSGAVAQHYKTSGFQAEKRNRILLGEPLAISSSKLESACEGSLRSLARLGSEAKAARGGARITNEEIDGSQGRDLLRMTKGLVIENLLAPYNQARSPSPAYRAV